jgi:L-asparagine oxygenase
MHIVPAASLAAKLLRLRLSPSLKHDWANAANHLNFPERGPWDHFINEAAAIAEAFLPGDIEQALKELRAYQWSALLIEGLPIDQMLPPVPTDGYRPTGKRSISEAVLLSLVERSASAFGYVQEKGGRLIHEVAPVYGKETERSNAGKGFFAPHCDNAFLPYQFRPQILALFGLVNEEGVPTLLYEVDGLLGRLDTADLDVLYEDEFRLRCPDSFGFARPFWVDCRSLLERVQNVTVAGFNRYNVEPTTPRARRAYGALCEAIDRAEPEQVQVFPGSILVFANARVLHGRAPIERGKRWLQRVYGTFDLAAMQTVAGHAGRIVDCRHCL